MLNDAEKPLETNSCILSQHREIKQEIKNKKTKQIWEKKPRRFKIIWELSNILFLNPNFIFLFLFSLCKCFAYMFVCVCVHYMWSWWPQSTDEDLRSSGTGVIGSAEPLYRCWTWILWNSSTCSYLLSRLSSPIQYVPEWPMESLRNLGAIEKKSYDQMKWKKNSLVSLRHSHGNYERKFCMCKCLYRG